MCILHKFMKPKPVDLRPVELLGPASYTTIIEPHFAKT